MSSYMNCVRCGLSVRLRADKVAWEYCPACVGRAGVEVPMYPQIIALAGHAPAKPNALHPRAGVRRDVMLLEPLISDQLVIEFEDESKGLVVALGGELDIATVPLVEDALAPSHPLGALGARGPFRAARVKDERFDRESVDFAVEPADERPDGSTGDPFHRVAELSNRRVLENILVSRKLWCSPILIMLRSALVSVFSRITVTASGPLQ